MTLDEWPFRVPDWVPRWCRDHLQDEPVAVLFRRRSISEVYGLRLACGRDVVVKAREDDGRAAACVAVQTRLAERGFPCALPLTPVVEAVGGGGEGDSGGGGSTSGGGRLVVHAEVYRPGGEVLVGDSPAVAGRYAGVFARLMAELAELDEAAELAEEIDGGDRADRAEGADGAVAPPLPNPRWARWDHGDPGLWPAIPEMDELDQGAVPEYVAVTAARARERLLALADDLPCVLGHADFEAQNLRWRGGQVWAVHDWDSLAWQPEAALVGAASGTFSSALPPTLAPVESSAAFLDVYEELRGRRFGPEEREMAWAASLWPAVHNARWEALNGAAPLCCDAVREQGDERLRRARAWAS